MPRKKQEGELRAKESSGDEHIDVATEDTKAELNEINKEEIANIEQKEAEAQEVREVIDSTAEKGVEMNQLPEEDKVVMADQMVNEVRAKLPTDGEIEQRELDGEMKEVRVRGGEPPTISEPIPAAGNAGFNVSPDSEDAAVVEQEAMLEQSVGHNDTRHLTEEEKADG